MRIKPIYRTAVRKYGDEGATATARAGASFVKNIITGQATPTYQSTVRVDNEERVNIISEHIPDEASNLLDIGCADGVLTEEFSNQELFCIGIEQNELRYDQACKREQITNSVRFLRFELTPQNIHTLPSFDVVLLLTVYHHWGRHFGWDAAENMLREVVAKTNTLFFEPPGRPLDGISIEGYDGDSITEYYQLYLESIFEENIQITHIGTADYSGGDRQDPIFLIENTEP